jgi:hypothetical protein
MKVSSGTAVVVGLIAVLVLGWFAYRAFIPPAWLRSFAEDISYRSTPDPDAPPPADAREAKPKAVPEHPYICFARAVPFAWDRMIVVPAAHDPRTVAQLSDAKWSSDELDDRERRMAHDPRIQLIVLLKDHRVVADAYFYTFWGDLTALGIDGGFSPTTAVFTAAVKNATHVLTPVSPAPSVCKGSP